MPKKSEAEVVSAEKKVGAVLDELEEKTESDVEKISLEELVDTDEETGQPEVLKGVDIQVKPRSTRNWSR